MIIFNNIFDTCSILCLYPPQYPVSLYKWPPPPLQPCMGQHLHFERNLEKLKEPTNILETFEKKKKKIRVLEIWKWAWKIENDS